MHVISHQVTIFKQCFDAPVICFADAHSALLQPAATVLAGVAVFGASLVALAGWRREDAKKRRAQEDFTRFVQHTMQMISTITWHAQKLREVSLLDAAKAIGRAGGLLSEAEAVLRIPREEWPSAQLLFTTRAILGEFRLVIGHLPTADLNFEEQTKRLKDLAHAEDEFADAVIGLLGARRAKFRRIFSR